MTALCNHPHNRDLCRRKNGEKCRCN